MTGQILIEPTVTATNRRQPLLDGTLTPSQQPPPPKKRKSTAKEVAGVTTANCLIICCCCPCIVVEFFILAVYKVPVNLCRKMWKNHRSKKMKKKKKINNKRLLELHNQAVSPNMSNNGEVHQSGGSEVYYKSCCYFDDFENLKNFDHHQNQNVLEIIKIGSCDDGNESSTTTNSTSSSSLSSSLSSSSSTVDWDNKMWDQFHSTGFWRSSSQRDT